MKLDLQGLHLIASYEGFVPHPYNDSAGNATIGYGHLLHLGLCTAEDYEHWGNITIDQGLELLESDTDYYAEQVTDIIHVRLGLLTGRAAARFGALCSLSFNIGAGAFRSSSLVRVINMKGAPREWEEVSPYWLEWDHAGGAISDPLLARRRSELSIFVSGKYPRT
jgi:lysozyme